MSARKLRTAAATDIGRRRSGNEDSYIVWTAEAAGRPHAADRLLVVCDGMGGTNAGEVASRMTVDAVVRAFAESTESDPAAALSHAVQTANAEIWEHVQTRTDLQGMGTTCTAVAIRGDEACVAHVGDSRAYLVRGEHIRQLTHDHSLVAQLVARGELTPTAAKSDSRRNVVTRSVGVGPLVDVDVVHLEDPLQPGDTIVICTDGLHGQVDDGEIASRAGGPSLDRGCRELIDLANERGGPDNITVALARLEPSDTDSFAPRPAAARPASPRRAEPRRAAPRAPRATARVAARPSRQRALKMLIIVLLALVLALSGLTWVVFGMMRAAPRDASAKNDSDGVAASWR